MQSGQSGSCFVMAQVDIAPSFGAELKVRGNINNVMRQRMADFQIGWLQTGQRLGMSNGMIPIQLHLVDCISN